MVDELSTSSLSLEKKETNKTKKPDIFSHLALDHFKLDSLEAQRIETSSERQTPSKKWVLYLKSIYVKWYVVAQENLQIDSAEKEISFWEPDTKIPSLFDPILSI